MAYDYERERQEAIEAGYKALDSLREAYMKLDSARGWGVYDILGGGFREEGDLLVENIGKELV